MKKINLLAVLVLSGYSLFAQFPTNWSADLQATPSLNYSNEGRKIITDAASNVFVLGDYSSDKDSSGHGSSTTLYSVRIHKYNYNGGLLTWAYIPVGGLINNGYDNRSGFGMVLDGSGNVYVGYSILNSSGNFDVVIAKYSNNLIKQWQLTYATPSNDIGVSLVLSGSVPFAVVKSYTGANVTYSIVKAQLGSTSATLVYSFVTNVDVISAMVPVGKTLYVTGYSIVSGVKVAKTAGVSVGGVLAFNSTFNHNSTTGDDYGNKLMVGNDGNIYVVGTTYTNAANGNDGLVLKYSLSGIQKGVLFLHNSTTDMGFEIASGISGFIYVGCANTSSMNIYKVQMNPLSANITATNFPTPISPFTAITNTVISDMKVAASGNVYVCGYVDATSPGGNFSASFLTKFGMNGFLFKMLNSNPVDGQFSNNYRPVSMVLDGYKNDILVLKNYFSNNTNHSVEAISVDDFDGGTSLRLGNENNFPNEQRASVSVFPNPASDKISINANEIITAIEIIDITGRTVKSIRMNELTDHADLNITDLKNGLYVCSITTVSGNVILKKFFVE